MNEYDTYQFSYSGQWNMNEIMQDINNTF
jgi:hypothetical protein